MAWNSATAGTGADALKKKMEGMLMNQPWDANLKPIGEQPENKEARG
jgi:hypothetical protein